MTFRIGIISARAAQAERRLAGVDHIIRGGDIGRPEIIDALRRIAPCCWAASYPETEVVRLSGKTIYVLHDLKTLQIDPIARGIDVVVSGHSHVPKIFTADGVALPESRKRRPAALPAAHHACDDRRDTGQPAAGNPRSRRRMNPSRGCASLKRWQVQMGRGRRRLGEVLAREGAMRSEQSAS